MDMFMLTALITVLSLNAVSCLPRFEGELLNPDMNHSPYTMPESCKGQTYCLEKGEDYPDEDDILEALEQYSWVKDSVHKFTHTSYHEGYISESECSGTHVMNAPIYYIVDEQNMTRAVIQSVQYFPQTFDLKWCNEEGPKNSTRHIFKNTVALLNIKLACETSYMTSNFYVLGSGDTLTMETASAKIPVCCKCRYEKPQY